MSRHAIQISSAKPPRGPYSPALRAGRLLFISGQLPVDPSTGRPVPGGIKEQTEQVLLNITALLEAIGAEPGDLVKTTVYLRDRAEWEPMNEVYQRHVGSVRPARSALVVGEMAHDVRVEIDAIALLPGRVKRMLRMRPTTWISKAFQVAVPARRPGAS